jgi:hypothetical protein
MDGVILAAQAPGSEPEGKLHFASFLSVRLVVLLRGGDRHFDAEWLALITSTPIL